VLWCVLRGECLGTHLYLDRRLNCFCNIYNCVCVSLLILYTAKGLLIAHCGE
jgi:hypothetical protein